MSFHSVEEVEVYARKMYEEHYRQAQVFEARSRARSEQFGRQVNEILDSYFEDQVESFSREMDNLSPGRVWQDLRDCMG
jgi:hypothetical protein